MNVITDFISDLDATKIILTIILILAIRLTIWYITREIKCWYWKISDILAEQQQQTELLEKILNEIKPDNTAEHLQGYTNIKIGKSDS